MRKRASLPTRYFRRFEPLESRVMLAIGEDISSLTPPVAAVSPVGVTADATLASSDLAVEHSGMGYFLVANSPRIERYDIPNEAWLSPIPLPNNLGQATVLHVDGDGLYLAYDKSVYRYGLDGSNPTHLLDAHNAVLGIHSDGNLLFINHSDSNDARFISVSKTTNAILDTFEGRDDLTGSSIAPQFNRIFGRSARQSPPDLHYVSYADDGTFTDGSNSPYHGVYPDASRTWVFPNGSKVIDDSGTIYSTAGLVRLGRLGLSISDLTFLGDDIPIVLQSDTLVAYTNTYQPVRTVYLTFVPDEIFVNSNHVITFKADAELPNGFQVDFVPLSRLNPPTPGQPVNPVGLAYSPDKVELAADGTVLVYSKAFQSIFRWDAASQSYTQSIPLINTADYMAYSAATNTAYLAYESGLIQQIDLHAADPVEMPFTTLLSRPLGLSTAGPYLYSVEASGSTGRHRTFAPTGELVDTVTASYFSSEYVWSDANQRMYYFGNPPTDLIWGQINANGSAYPGEPSGGIGQQKDSPIQDGSGFGYPIRVAPDGSMIVMGTGRIHVGVSLERLNVSLANSVVDATWIGGQLYTIRTVGSNAELQSWSQPTYAVSHSVYRPGTAYALKTLGDDRLLAISIGAGIPLFTLLNDKLEAIRPPTALFTVEETDRARSVSESGTKDTLRVVLNSQPASNVVLKITRSDSTELASIPSVTFTPSTWNIPQFVTLTPVNDSTSDGNQWSFVTIAVDDAASDPAFRSAADQIVMVITLDNETEVSTTLKHDGIGYFLVRNNPRIERFDIASAAWLSPIPLPGNLGMATAMHVDGDGLYVAYDKAIYRYGLNGSNAMHLLNVLTTVIALHTDGNLLFINHSSGSYARLISVNKSTNMIIDTLESYPASIVGSSIAPQVNRIFGRSSGLYPADITYASYADDGMFTNSGDSPYHDDYPLATRTWAFPNGSKVVDDSGTIYSTSGLTWLGRMGTTINDLDFLGDDVPIILRGSVLTAYTNAYQPTGSRTLPYAPNEIFVSSSHVITFKADRTLPTGLQVDLVPLGDLNPPTPGQPVNPDGLVYTPDKVELAADGTVLLYSKAFQSIFRWDAASQSYTQSIPLINTAKYMAYSAANNTAYLAYESGLIQRIDLDAADPTETPFAMLATGPGGLATAGPYVFLTDLAHKTFSPSGQLIDAKSGGSYSKHYNWSEANQKMYFLRDSSTPNDLLWEEINANGTTYFGEPPGGIGQTKDSPLHDSIGFTHPVRVAPDGSVVVLGSGQIHDAKSLVRLNTPLANSVVDATWLRGELYTIRTFGSNAELQRWSKPNYAIAQSLYKPGTAHALKTLGNDRLLAITIEEGIPRFTLLDDELETIEPRVVPSGDANLDGFVDGADYTIWADNYFKHVVGWHVHGDFDHNGFVDGADYTIWADNFLPRIESEKIPDTLNHTSLEDGANDTPGGDDSLSQGVPAAGAAAAMSPDTSPSITLIEAPSPLEDSMFRDSLARRDAAWAATVDSYIFNYFSDGILEKLLSTQKRIKPRGI